MSAEPLTPATAKMIVLTDNYNYLRDEALNYDMSGSDPIFHWVGDGGTFATAMALPVDTPWCAIGTHHEGRAAALQARFGEPKTFAQCLQAQNNEYAIHPKKLRGA